MENNDHHLTSKWYRVSIVALIVVLASSLMSPARAGDTASVRAGLERFSPQALRMAINDLASRGAGVCCWWIPPRDAGRPTAWFRRYPATEKRSNPSCEIGWWTTCGRSSCTPTRSVRRII